ncbi:LOW QUALITY PROTEIN: lactosylceramide 4-alpha-galactosyltransferase-like [Neltuma alba]|uniref:LOW QUALITY PROTEIN: lactosylceramide 4-alpha-galactosyltransferase-like n=1 Tax=Neltuma alba TaxID=207710 RepID=UPI0010A2F13C|nr:LOW QUALITY PROTEIN: lactosylceramide 4-alpha-galactosyltransferase-like [Prosopis alba]
MEPHNKTPRDRLAREKLHESRILKSNVVTRQFHRRVLGILSNKCESQFLITGISPARLFLSRELLSLKTLFKVHPRACLIRVSRTLDSKQGKRILRPLTRIDRGFKVASVTPDLQSLFRKTPAKAWLHDLRKGKDPGKIPLSQNLSNLIRLVTLYKYGGIYLDTDFIVLKSFQFFGLRNSIAAQGVDPVSKNWTRLNNAVLLFDKNHPLLFRFIEDFETGFDGNKWGHNGPYMVSRVVERVKEVLKFTILPPTSFYHVVYHVDKKPRNEEEARWIEGFSYRIRISK